MRRYSDSQHQERLRGILKHDIEVMRDKNIHKSKQKTESEDDKKKGGRLKFDEMNIIETLHPAGKDYGHMIIDEPKTPYLVEESEKGSFGGGVDPGELTLKLEEIELSEGSDSDKKKSVGTESDVESGIDEKSGGAISEDVKKFLQKRKSHYDEFKFISAARNLLAHEASNDDEGQTSQGHYKNNSSKDSKNKKT